MSKPDDMFDSFGSMGGDPVENVMYISQKKTFLQRHKNKIVFAVIVSLLIFVIGGSAYGWLNNSKVNAVSQEAEDNFNPSWQVRYDSLGADVIKAYYNGGSMPVAVSTAVTLPEEGASSDDVSEDSTNLVQVSDVSFLKGKKYIPQMGEDWDEENSKVFPNPYREKLTYRAEMNKVPVLITISLMVPQVYANKENGTPTLERNPTVGSAVDLREKITPADGNPKGAGLTPVDFQKSKDAKDVLTKFAEAWSTGNSDELRAMVNDGTDRVYTSPGGFQLDGEVTINWAYNQSFVDDPSSYAVARITFPVSQVKTGIKTEDGERTETEVKFGFVQTMDVLLKMGDQAIPNVVSWGDMWKDLKPYSVGQAPGSDVQATVNDPESTETETPGESSSSTPTTSGSSSSSTPSTTPKP